MKTGGEGIEQGRNEATGWESVAALADKMESNEKYSPKTDFEMYLATVGEVDKEDVIREISKYTEKIEKGELEGIYDVWAADPEKGADTAVRYFAGIFEVDPVPEVKFASKDESEELEGNPGGFYRDDENGGVLVINRDGSDEDDILFRVESVGHEMWHARQHRVAKQPGNERGALYQYNIDNYIKQDVSPGLYKQQLVEAEAYAVGGVISELLSDHEKKINVSRRNEVENALKPEVLDGVVVEAMKDFSSEQFMDAIGAVNLEQLNDSFQKDPIEKARITVEYLSGLLGDDEQYGVEEMEWRQGMGADVEKKQLLLNSDWAREQSGEEMVAMVANLAYWLRGAKRRYDPEDKKGSMYRYGERIGRDLLKAESVAFAKAVRAALLGENDDRQGGVH